MFKITLMAMILLLGGCKTEETSNKLPNKDTKIMNSIQAVMETSKGNITIELEFEKTPMTVANFVGLSEGTIKNESKPLGEPYYDGLIFHRVIPDFMIQGGDPDGSGSGGPGYQFPDEFDTSLTHSKPGVLSMANAGPGTNGSQFFITHKETPWLDGKHSIFGHVVEGQDIINAIEQNDVIKHVTILRTGDKANNFNAAEIFKNKLSVLDKNKKEKEKLMQVKINELTKGTSKTPEGLYYIILENGKGDKPHKKDNVSVSYSGSLMDGTIFDSGVYEFPLGVGKVIKGWDIGIALLNKGGKAKFIIPPQLAYGSRGAGGVIPPNATLIFEVELLDIKPGHHHDHSDPNHTH